jgi:putative acetyltransferase
MWSAIDLQGQAVPLAQASSSSDKERPTRSSRMRRAIRALMDTVSIIVEAGSAPPADKSPMPRKIQIVQDDLSGAATQDLLRLHLRQMRADSPPGTSFALDLSALQAPEITLWSGWIGSELAGVGALKDLGAGWGEVKSMRTHPRFLRQGVASQLLEHIIGTARARGMRRLSLETGTAPSFEPAIALYRRRGFVDGPAFADYPRESSFNLFLHLQLTAHDS